MTIRSRSTTSLSAGFTRPEPEPMTLYLRGELWQQPRQRDRLRQWELVSDTIGPMGNRATLFRSNDGLFCGQSNG